MSKIREAARGQDCQVRLFGICNHDTSTVVLAHLNGGGMGMKMSDIHGAFCCSACHDALDRRIKTPLTRDQLRLAHLEGMVRTQIILQAMGKL